MPDADASDRFRLFIAVQIPEEVKNQLERAQAELRRAAGDAHIRWVGREQFHLTLKFLGDVQSERLEPLVAAVRGACQGFGTLHLRAQGIGFFPDPRHPRVVWAGVHDSTQQLGRVQTAVEAAVQPFTSEAPEGRGFSGHVTLGRVKGIRRSEAQDLEESAAGMGGRLLGEWPAREVEIIRSELSPAGAIYTTLAAEPLVGG